MKDPEAPIGMFEAVATAYSTVFTPELFVFLCGILAVGYEWRRLPDRSRRGLGARLGVLLVGWLVGLAIYLGVRIGSGPVPKWVQDATGSVGLVVGLSLVWGAWRYLDWGRLVPSFAGLLVAVSVPHLLITPVWDVSTHVLYAVVPAGTLAAVDRRFTLLLFVPAGMVVARPLAGAHTWPQSLGGLVLGLLALLAFWRVANFTGPGRATAPPRPAESVDEG